MKTVSFECHNAKHQYLRNNPETELKALPGNQFQEVILPRGQTVCLVMVDDFPYTTMDRVVSKDAGL